VDPSKFVAPQVGEVVPSIGPDGTYSAFIPRPIPRALELAPSTVSVLSKADMALGRLAGAGRLLPNPHILANAYVVREAVSSSAIEGTQASIPDIYRAAAVGETSTSRGDVAEVRNYIDALNQGLTRLGTLPISKRLVAEIHAVLLSGVRGRERTPGEFRRSQNYIGSPDDRPQSAVFVPPPPGEPMEHALADWEKFSHESIDLPLLVRCALLHYQFETIHPFLDGNGRLGRLLIVFFLVEQGALPSPLLYLSSYFEQRRSDYTGRLQAVRERGEIQEWLQFFLHGVEVQATDAVARAERLADLRERYRHELAGTRSRATEVVDLLFENPIASAPGVAASLGITGEGAKYLIMQLEERSILRPFESYPGRRKTWLAEDILEIVAEDQGGG
jgi:Fic family protein